MARELRISIDLSLPEGASEEAWCLVACKPAIEGMASAFPDGARIEWQIVTPKPRGEKPEGPPA